MCHAPYKVPYVNLNVCLADRTACEVLVFDVNVFPPSKPSDSSLNPVGLEVCLACTKIEPRITCEQGTTYSWSPLSARRRNVNCSPPCFKRICDRQGRCPRSFSSLLQRFVSLSPHTMLMPLTHTLVHTLIQHIF